MALVKLGKQVITPLDHLAHVRYKLKDGTPVVGASTVAKEGQSFEGLLQWAYNQGIKGLDFKKTREKAASIGSIGHAIFEGHVTGREVDLLNCAPADVDIAENCALKAMDLWQREKFELVACEKELVSERHKFGGKVDIIAKNDKGEHILLDWKSSNQLYLPIPNGTQLAAYEALWNENNPDKPIMRRGIIRIGKRESEKDFEERWLGDTNNMFELFLIQLELYRKKKEFR